MFKLGFARVFMVFIACNCYKNSQAEDPAVAEKQEDVIAGDTGGQGNPSEYDDGLDEYLDVNDNGETLKEIDFEDENGEDVFSENKDDPEEEGQNWLI